MTRGLWLGSCWCGILLVTGSCQSDDPAVSAATSHARRVLRGGVGFGVGHSRAGTLGITPSDGVCPTESPLLCRNSYGTFCCPTGTTCDPNYLHCRVDGVAAVCPANAPTACGTECCLPSESCTGSGCRLPPTTPACPDTSPVDCGNNDCCQNNLSCTDTLGMLHPGSCCNPGTDSCTTSATLKCPSWSQACGTTSGTCCPADYSCDTDLQLCQDRYLSQRGVCSELQNRCNQTGTLASYCCPGSQWCTDAGIQDGCAQAGALLVAATGQGSTFCWDGTDYMAIFCPLTALACPNVNDDTGGICCPGEVGAGVNTPFCDGTCCPAGTLCEAGGRCACSDTEFACGDVCCPVGTSCEDGQCAPVCNAAYPVRCGDECCAAGIACVASRCTCPDEHPLECSLFCCLPGTSCTANGDCACPSGQVPCANDVERCCPKPPDPTCSAGQLLFGCPDGTTRCCSENMVCCRDSMNGGAVGCEFSGFCE